MEWWRCKWRWRHRCCSGPKVPSTAWTGSCLVQNSNFYTFVSSLNCWKKPVNHRLLSIWCCVWWCRFWNSEILATRQISLRFFTCWSALKLWDLIFPQTFGWRCGHGYLMLWSCCWKVRPSSCLCFDGHCRCFSSLFLFYIWEARWQELECLRLLLVISVLERGWMSRDYCCYYIGLEMSF